MMGEVNSELEMVKINLRAVLMSSTRGVSLKFLMSDYEEFISEELDYKKLGSKTLEEFLRTKCGDTCRLCPDIEYPGKLKAIAIADEDTKFMEDMQRKTRKPKLKKKKVVRMGVSFRHGVANSHRSSAQKYSAAFSNNRRTSKAGANPAPAQSKMFSKPPFKPPMPKKPSAESIQIPKKKFKTTVSSWQTYSSYVAPIIKSKKFGILKADVERLYEEKYKECLPEDWVDKLENRILEVAKNFGNGMLLIKFLSKEEANQSTVTNSGDQNASAASVKAEPKNLRFSTKEPTVINSYKGNCNGYLTSDEDISVSDSDQSDWELTSNDLCPVVVSVQKDGSRQVSCNLQSGKAINPSKSGDTKGVKTNQNEDNKSGQKMLLQHILQQRKQLIQLKNAKGESEIEVVDITSPIPVSPSEAIHQSAPALEPLMSRPIRKPLRQPISSPIPTNASATLKPVPSKMNLNENKDISSFKDCSHGNSKLRSLTPTQDRLKPRCFNNNIEKISIESFQKQLLKSELARRKSKTNQVAQISSSLEDFVRERSELVKETKPSTQVGKFSAYRDKEEVFISDDEDNSTPPFNSSDYLTLECICARPPTLVFCSSCFSCEANSRVKTICQLHRFTFLKCDLIKCSECNSTCITELKEAN